MQIGIVIACFLLVRLFTSCAHWPAQGLRYLKLSHQAPGTTQCSMQHHIPALTTALIDFHKAQCYFMIAAQLASIVMLQRPGAFDASSYMQLLANYRFLATISCGGILPILILLVEIHILDQRSLYMLTLSIVVSAVSTWVCVAASTRRGPYSSLVPGPYTTPECGGVYVYKYCSGSDNNGIYSYGIPIAKPLLVFAWVMYALLVLDMAAHRLPRFSKFVVSQDQQKAARCKRWRIQSVPRTCLVCLLFGYYAGCVYFIWLYIRELTGITHYATINSKWTFGQIVSVTIWFAPIFEYFYLEICGMRHGYRYRLREPYVVVNRNDIAGALQHDRGRSRISALLLNPFGTLFGIDAGHLDTQESKRTTK